ncbi:hypothetical protein [Emticicia agri]|uniref:Uncharacterized protein n=1 Tax=Emticicia agri TaxID=2492393 RepID=A0A4Q5LU63_9BACT|nr:hypothetical protein [Emticicia agri]RYU93191.1 hypothetical protein EWM59_23220 [Emticicia agri]
MTALVELEMLLNDLESCIYSVVSTDIKKQLIDNDWKSFPDNVFEKKINTRIFRIYFDEVRMFLKVNLIFYDINEQYFFRSEDGKKEEWANFNKAFYEINDSLRVNENYKLIVLDSCYSDDEDLGEFKYAYHLYKQQFIVGIQQTYSNEYSNPSIVSLILLDKTHDKFPVDIF